MAEKPTSLPNWATGPGTTVEPGYSDKEDGFKVSTKPPARWFNYLFNLIYKWIQYLNAPVGTGTGAGVSATGGSTSGPGLKGTGGAPNGNGIEGYGDGNGSGVYGIGEAGGSGEYGSVGVFGTSGGGAGVYGVGVGDAGVVGESANGSFAMYAKGTGGNVGGLRGESYGNANGVEGVGSGTGHGVYGSAGAGHGVVAQGDTSSPAISAFRIVPQDADPTGPNQIGDMYVNTAGVLHICTVAGSPGTWTHVGAQT